jgi:hypothetical protein
MKYTVDTTIYFQLFAVLHATILWYVYLLQGNARETNN